MKYQTTTVCMGCGLAAFAKDAPSNCHRRKRGHIVSSPYLAFTSFTTRQYRQTSLDALGLASLQQVKIKILHSKFTLNIFRRN